MNEPIFLPYESGVALHRIGLELHGGEGTPDSGRLDAALNQPKWDWLYGHGDHFDIAASYAYNVSQGHVFTHGNKTAAALAALTYLELNGISTRQYSNTIIYDAISGLGANVDKVKLAAILRTSLPH